MPWIRNITDEDYRAMPGVFSSRLKTILDSPLDYYEYVSTEPTAAMRRGTLIHKAVLEPEKLKVVVLPSLEGLTDDKGVAYANPAASNKGKAILAAFRSDNAGADIVSKEDYETLNRIRDNAAKNEMLQDLLFGAECELVGQHERIKGKLDLIKLFERVISDVKTTQDCSTHALQKAVQNYRYDFQLAFYLSLAASIESIDVTDFETNWIFIQTCAPFHVRVMNADAWMQHGFEQLNKAFELLEQCEKSGQWPGLQNGALEVPVYLRGAV